MPEHSETQTDPDHAEFQRAFHKELDRVRTMVTEIVEDAHAEGADPVAALLEAAADFSRVEPVFGRERVAVVRRQLMALDAYRTTFVQDALALLEPMLHDLFFDPDIRAAAETHEKARRPKEYRIGKLIAVAKVSEWTFALPDGTRVGTDDDRVLEISWPDKDPPTIIGDLHAAFRELAALLDTMPEVYAVVAVSWIMSHPLAKKIGFTVFPDLPVAAETQTHILDLATTARRGKYHDREVHDRDVQVGAMSRTEFLRRYG